MKIVEPKVHLIEQVAAEFAGTFYDIGRSQGLKSKHKTPLAYAKANLEKFIPAATKHLISMLGRSDIPDLMKERIWEAIEERINDPDVKKWVPPEIDISKVIPTKQPSPVVINIQDYKADKQLMKDKLLTSTSLKG